MFPVSCLMLPWALPVWVSRPGLPAGNLSSSVQKRGREEKEWHTAAHTHTQTHKLHPKEEQHASPGGHLFSQVCSPNVIKIGATHPPSNAALVRQHCGCWGISVRRKEQLCCLGADGNDDESLKRRKQVKEKTRGMEEASYARKFIGSFTANNCLQTLHSGRLGLFGEHADYPLLFDTQKKMERSCEKTGVSHTWE